MRIEFASTTHPSNVAKALKRELAAHGAEIKLSKVQDAVARMTGYRNWKDLTSNVPSPTPSPFDAEASADEVKARRTRHVDILSETFSLARAKAGEIVDRIRPTGIRNALAVAPESTEEWRTRLEEYAKTSAFSTSQVQRIREVLAGGGFHDRKVTSKAIPGLGTVHVTYAIGDREGVEDFRIDDVYFYLERDGRFVAELSGHVIVVNQEIKERADDEFDDEFEWEFFDACDRLDDSIAETANALNDQGLSRPLCVNGSTLVVGYLLRDMTRTKPGEGASFLKEAILLYRAFARRPIVNLTFNSAPAQFADIDYNARLPLPSYKAAAENLKKAFSAPILREALGKKAMVVHYDLGPADETGRGDMALIASNMGVSATPDEEDFPLKRTLNNTYAMLAATGNVGLATLTAPSEPRMIPAETPPPGLEWTEAAQFKSIRPHADFWKSMPSEMVSLRLQYSGETEDSHVGPRPAFLLTCRFANGTEISVPSEHIVAGLKGDDCLPALRTASDTMLIKNPYTSRMGVFDLHHVLTINSVLLFDGRPGIGRSTLPQSFDLSRPDAILRPVE